MVELRTRARFPEVALDAPHYESFYLKAAHPTEPLGVWIRHTAFKRPGERPVGSLWFVLFDSSAGGPAACKATLGPDALGAGDDHYVHVGESRLESGRATGTVAAGGREASWELEFDPGEPPIHHLPKDWMYRAPIPRTKSLSPYPATSYRGYVKFDGREVALEGWPGMVGHNWGSQHAERWIWLQGTAFANADTWLDAVIGRIKVGPLTSPWIGNGTLSLEGRRYAVGGIERVRATEVDEAPDRCHFRLPGKEVDVRGAVSADRANVVGWIYSDPDGSDHNTVNCSIARMKLAVARPGAPDVELETASGATYELGMREKDHGIPIQPFPDP